MLRKFLIKWIYGSPIIWAIVGLLIGFMLGVTTISTWFVAIGLGGFLVYLRLHGKSRSESEGWLFSSGPVFLMSWVFGLVVRGLLL